jgi:diguanylate cyclase (GGDEF)-like protein/PAS domain S-box-containing protein
MAATSHRAEAFDAHTAIERTRSPWHLALASAVSTLFSVPAILLLRWLDLVANSSLAIMMFAISVSSLVNIGRMFVISRWKSRERLVRATSIAAIVATAAVAYSSGWGPMLVIGYILATAEGLRISGSKIAPLYGGATIVVTLIGELLVHFGVTKSLLPVGLSHAVAILSIMMAIATAMILADFTRAAEDATAEVASSATHFANLVAHAEDVIISLDRDNVILYANPSIQRVMGVDPAAIIGQPMERGGEDVLWLLRRIEENGRTPGSVTSFDWQTRHSNGTPIRFAVTASVPADTDGSETILNLHDVTLQRMHTAALRHKADHDHLTGLMNRAAFTAESRLALANPDRQHALLFMDLDRFKAVNDMRGHAVGDAVLISVAEKFQQVMRSDDLLARIGGDEFAALIPYQQPADAIQIAERLILAAESSHAGLPAGVLGVSVGIVLHEECAVDQLNFAADEAMYRAKRAGGGRWAGKNTMGEPPRRATAEHTDHHRDDITVSK